MSPLPLLACFLLLGGLILAVLYALRRGIQEQQELDALSDLVEYENEDETLQRAVAPAPSQHSKPTEGAALPR